MDSAFPDYQRLVMEYYQRKKSLDRLHSHLIHPTQAKLKKASLLLCKGKVPGKDEKILKDFCEEWDDTKNCFENIKKYDVDKFKPLYNYMRGESENPDAKYIQLLAWLIEFPIRPYDYTKDYTGITGDDLLEPQEAVERKEPASMQINKIAETEDSQTTIDTKAPVEEKITTIDNKDNNAGRDKAVEIDEEAKDEPATTPKQRYRKVIIVAALLAIIGGGGYWWWDTQSRYNMSFEHGGCMYWAEDHYQPIPCSQKVPNKLVIALDSVKVRNFKKITQPDTITYRSIGGVWYSKIYNKVEFFTSDGEHPVIIGRHLKPITSYIIDKYINQGMTSSQ